MKFTHDKKKKLTWWIIEIATVCILIFLVAQNSNVIIKAASRCLEIISPLLSGLIIALILNVPMKFFESHLWNKTKNKFLQKIRKPASFIISLVLILGILTMIFYLVIPELFEATKAQGSVLYIKMDDYYKRFIDIPTNEQGAKNFDHPDSYDVDLLTNHLKTLKSYKSVNKPTYSFVTSDRCKETELVNPADVIIIDGIMTFAHPEVRKCLDIKIFVDTPDDIRFIRRLERDIVERGRTVTSVVNQYLTSVRPMHHAFVEPSKQYADIIVPFGGHNDVAIELITNQILSLLKK